MQKILHTLYKVLRRIVKQLHDSLLKLIFHLITKHHQMRRTADAEKSVDTV